jgi:hypothetical protein
MDGIGAVIADAQIDGIATPCEELRHHKHQDEQ